MFPTPPLNIKPYTFQTALYVLYITLSKYDIRSIINTLDMYTNIGLILCLVLEALCFQVVHPSHSWEQNIWRSSTCWGNLTRTQRLPDRISLVSGKGHSNIIWVWKRYLCRLKLHWLAETYNHCAVFLVCDGCCYNIALCIVLQY